MLNVTIWRDANGEYKVPAPDRREASAYFTDDRDDAVATFDKMWAERFRDDEVTCKIKSCSEHPQFLSD